MQNLYDQLTALLDKHHAQYRLIDHKEEGRTEIVSSYRGNKLEQAAKCMVLVVHLGKKEKKYVLGVIPGDKQIDFDAVRKLFGASYVSFAPSDVAEELSGSVVGTVLPFSFRPDLELIVDPNTTDALRVQILNKLLDQTDAENFFESSDVLADTRLGEM